MNTTEADPGFLMCKVGGGITLLNLSIFLKYSMKMKLFKLIHFIGYLKTGREGVAEREREREGGGGQANPLWHCIYC